MKSGMIAGLILAALLLAAQTGSGIPTDAGKLVEGGKENGHQDSFVQNGEKFVELNEFSKNLMKELGKTDVMSPFSAYMALGMTAAGARGETVKAFGCLGFDGTNRETLGAKAKSLIDYLTAPEGSTVLEVANSVWVDDAYTLRDEFSAYVKKYYSAEVFSEDLPKSVSKVNSWISEKTNGMIRDLLDEIGESDKLLLINAVYMDAKWSDPFDPQATREGDFVTSSGEKKKMELMRKTEYTRTIDADGLEGVVLPYDDGRLEFVAILPTDGQGIDSLYESLTGEYDFASLAEKSKTERVRLTLPKLELSATFSLKSPLSALGMSNVFSNSADLSGLCGEPGELCVSDVIQSAKLKLDESGTEAAAVTIVSVKATSLVHEEPPRVISFTSPFAYAVVDSETSTVLFTGVVE